MARYIPDLRLPAPVRQHMLSWVVLVTMAGLYLLAGLSVAVGDSGPQVQTAHASAAVPSPMPRPAAPQEPPPAPEPLDFRSMTMEEAMAWNASVSVSTTANPAAKPFAFAPASEADRLRALDCLTHAVYYEAATEPVDGQRAVAQVVLNRVRHPAYPATVCGVVFEGAERATGCQFTFTCDGALARRPHAGLWAQARKIAEEALAGKVYAPVGWATHYHTNWVVPYWAGNLTKAANVGTHIFYRWEGGWGRPPAFKLRHAGAEPLPAKLGGSAPAETQPEVALAEAKDAAAAEAAAKAPPPESGPRPVIRRFEPFNQERARTVIADRARAESLPAGQRWALTGDSSGGSQPPLGQKAEPEARPAQ